MLAIRMQRTGRSGHSQFRVIVQDSRFSPKRGRVTAFLGSYDPHTKVAVLDKDKASQYLTNGAQPSDRVAKLLQKEGVKLPDWVKLDGEKQRKIRNLEKLRRNQPADAKAEISTEPAEASAEETPVAEGTSDAPAEEATPEVPAEESLQDVPAGEETSEPAAKTEVPAEEAPAAEDKTE